MKHILSFIISGALAVSSFGQTRNVLVGTNNTVVQPTNFWSADASNARSGLGLGTAATNPASAFQSSSLVLSNLASSNAINITNLRSTNIVGILSIEQGGTGSTNITNARTALGLGSAATNASSAFQGASSVLSNLASSNAVNLTNLRATNIVGTFSVSQGGTGSTNAADARTALGLGTASTNPSSAFQPSSAILSNLAAGSGLSITNIAASNITGVVAISNGGTGATNAATSRTNLELGFSALTNTNAVNFRNSISIGTTNEVVFDAIVVSESTNLSSSGLNGIQWRSIFPSSNGLIGIYGSDAQGTTTFGINIGTMSGTTAEIALFNASRITFYEPLEFNNITNAAITRTNLSLGWSALTNNSSSSFQAALFGSNTNPVLVNTNGDVVSPTNFWQQAPIATTVAFSAPITNSTNTATNSRNLIIQSLATNIVNVTNTLLLPTNSSTFNGDTAVVIHAGGTNSATAVRQAGQTSNLIVITNFDHAVRFLYFNNTWDFYHNVAYVEPIYFSGTNTAANAGASRTNLGLGALDNVTFDGVYASNINVSDISIIGGNIIQFNGDDIIQFYSDRIRTWVPIEFDNTNAASVTRTNLGIPLAALTNTNNANFQAAVFATNAAPTNSANVNTVNFNTAVAWIQITVSTNGTNHSFRIPLFQ